MLLRNVLSTLSALQSISKQKWGKKTLHLDLSLWKIEYLFIVIIKFQDKYHESLTRKKLKLDNTKKLVVTDRTLDQWYGIQASLDIDQFPIFRPPGVNKVVYDTLKKYASAEEEQ